MAKLDMDAPLGGGIAPRLVVKVQRQSRPPTPWAWTIHEEGRAEPFRCSTRLYRCAEDAWAVGHAVLDRLPRPVAWRGGAG
jgi:hypothetical protein